MPVSDVDLNIVLAKEQAVLESIVGLYRQTVAKIALLGGKPKSTFFLFDGDSYEFVDHKGERQLLRALSTNGLSPEEALKILSEICKWPRAMC